MQIEHTRKRTKAFFFIFGENKPLTQIVYTLSLPEKMIVEHTESDHPLLKGKKAGYRLVNHLVDYTGANHFKVISLCPFAQSVIKKIPQLQDVLFKPPLP